MTKTAEDLARISSTTDLAELLKNYKREASIAALNNDHESARKFYANVAIVTHALTLKGTPPVDDTIAAVLA